MATPFETFVQTELPKRPYLANDVAQESIIIRRGIGPMQLDGLQLANGQVLGMIDGSLAAINQTAVNYAVQEFEVAATTWTITHGRGNKNAQVVLRDAADKEIKPDEIEFTENTIVITWYEAQAGTAVALFLG